MQIVEHTLIKSALLVAVSALLATFLPLALQAQTADISCQKKVFADLQGLNCRKAILDLLPIYAHDTRKDLTKPGNAKTVARDLAWIARAMMFDENEISAVSVLSMAHTLSPDDLSITAALIDNCSRAGYPERAHALIAACRDKQNLQIVKVRANVAMRELAVLQAQRLLNDYASAPETAKIAADDAGFAVIQARCTLKVGLQKAAAKEYSQAAKISKNPYVSELWKAAAISLEIDPSDQEQSEKKRLEQIEIIKQAGTLNENDPAWHIDLAAAYGHHDLDNSKKQLELASHCARFASRIDYGLSSNLQSEQKWTEAEKCLQHVISMRPRSAEAQFNLIRPLRRQKKYDAAIAVIRKGLLFNPRAGGARTDLISILIEQKKDDDAFKEIQAVTQLCPEFANGWRKMGDFYRKEKKFPDSIVAYRHALSLYKSNYDDLSILARSEIAQLHAGMGTVYYLQGDKVKALEEAKAFNNGKFVVHLAKGLELLHLRPDRIILSKLAKERGMQEHIMLADMLFDTKTYNESLSEYKEAAKVNDDDADLHTYILNVCTESGQWQEAFHEDIALSNVLVKSAPAKIGDLFKKQFSP